MVCKINVRHFWLASTELKAAARCWLSWRSIFTKAEMSEEDLASTSFSMTFVARGYTGESGAICWCMHAWSIFEPVRSVSMLLTCALRRRRCGGGEHAA